MFLLNMPNELLIVIFLSASGLIIRTSLVMTGQTWANTYHYLGSYILLPNIAYIITTVISNNIALALGMIGALSIVRFRHPVRSHFELTIFFALVTLGIAASVNQKFAGLLLFIILFTTIGIHIAQKISVKIGFSLFNLSFTEGDVRNFVEIETNKNLEVFLKEKNLVNTYYEKEKNVWEYKLAFDKREDLNNFLDSISDIKDNIISLRTSHTN